MDEAQNAEPADAKAIANEVCAPISWAVLIFILIQTFLVWWWMVFDVGWSWIICGEMHPPGGNPAVTKIFIRYSFIPWLVALAGIAGLVKEFLVHNRRVTLIINATHLVFLAALHQLFLAAMYLPLIKLMDFSER